MLCKCFRWMYDVHKCIKFDFAKSTLQMCVLEHKEIRALWERIISEGFTDELQIKNFRITWDELNEPCDAIEQWWWSEKSPLFTFSLEDNCSCEFVHTNDVHNFEDLEVWRDVFIDSFSFTFRKKLWGKWNCSYWKWQLLLSMSKTKENKSLNSREENSQRCQQETRDICQDDSCWPGSSKEHSSEGPPLWSGSGPSTVVVFFLKREFWNCVLWSHDTKLQLFGHMDVANFVNLNNIVENIFRNRLKAQSKLLGLPRRRAYCKACEKSKWNQSEVVQQLLKVTKTKVLEWPAQSQVLNHIENLWRLLTVNIHALKPEFGPEVVWNVRD